MYFVYILESQKDKKYYIGQTRDIKERLERHNTGQVSATRNRRPLKLTYYEEFGTRAEAMQREKYLKSLKGGNEFKRLVKL